MTTPDGNDTGGHRPPDNPVDLNLNLEEDTDGNRLRLLAWWLGKLCRDTQTYEMMMEVTPDTLIPAMQKHLEKMADRLDKLDVIYKQAAEIQALREGKDEVQH